MYRRMKTSALALLFVILNLNTSLYAQELRKEGKFWVGEITKTFKVEPGGSLVLDEVRGNVTIRTWDKKEVEIREKKRMDIFTKAEAEAAMEESESGYQKTGNTITVSGPAFDRNWIHSRFDINVPADFDCDIETQGGELDIGGLKGDLDASTGGGNITLFDIDGTVEAKTGGGNIEIEKTTQRVNASTGGGNVRIENSKGYVKASTGGGNVTIFETQDEVRISTGGGNVEINSAGGEINVSTGGGQIEIRDAGGNVTVSTGGGEIDIRNLKGDLRASSGGGSITGKTVMGMLRVSTGGGDVGLEDIKGPIDISTGGGDIDAEVTLEDFSQRHDVEMSTGGGDIHLVIPDKLPATIEAEIRYNLRSWEDYEIDSDFPLKITKDEDGRHRIIRGVGEINGGGDPIRLKTGGGNIRIKKAR